MELPSPSDPPSYEIRFNTFYKLPVVRPDHVKKSLFLKTESLVPAEEIFLATHYSPLMVTLYVTH